MDTTGGIKSMDLIPDEYRKNILEIDYDKLLSQGKRVFIFDFDNTIGKWKSQEIPEKFKTLVEYLKRKGAEVFIVSNGSPRKLNCDIPIIWRAMKPLPFAFKRKIKPLIEKEEKSQGKVVVIGDQIFTDILFGKLIGAYTIKVDPINTEHEFLSTKFLRFFERIFGLQRKDNK